MPAPVRQIVPNVQAQYTPWANFASDTGQTIGKLIPQLYQTWQNEKDSGRLYEGVRKTFMSPETMELAGLSDDEADEIVQKLKPRGEEKINPDKYNDRIAPVVRNYKYWERENKRVKSAGGEGIILPDLFADEKVFITAVDQLKARTAQNLIDKHNETVERGNGFDQIWNEGMERFENPEGVTMAGRKSAPMKTSVQDIMQIAQDLGVPIEMLAPQIRAAQTRQYGQEIGAVKSESPRIAGRKQMYKETGQVPTKQGERALEEIPTQQEDARTKLIHAQTQYQKERPRATGAGRKPYDRLSAARSNVREARTTLEQLRDNRRSIVMEKMRTFDEEKLKQLDGEIKAVNSKIRTAEQLYDEEQKIFDQEKKRMGMKVSELPTQAKKPQDPVAAHQARMQAQLINKRTAGMDEEKKKVFASQQIMAFASRYGMPITPQKIMEALNAPGDDYQTNMMNTIQAIATYGRKKRPEGE